MERLKRVEILPQSKVAGWCLQAQHQGIQVPTLLAMIDRCYT